MGTNLITQTIDVVPSLTDIATLHYAIGKGELKNLTHFINSSIADGYAFNFNNPSELIISLRAYPFWMSNWFASVDASSTFPIGRFKASEVNVKGAKLGNQRNHISLGKYKIERYFNNFMDYDTRIDMYIPAGFGFVTLNTKEVMGKEIDIRASMDFDNGIMTIYIVCEDVVIQSFSNKIGIDIALTQTNNVEQSRNAYMWFWNSVGGVGDIFGSKQENWNSKAISTGVNIGTSLYKLLEHHVHAGNIGVGRTQLVAPTSIYLIIQRVNPIAINDDYLRINGKPLEDYRTLSTMTGYTIVGDIHLSGFDNATEGEITEIETLLKQGVHL